MPAASAPGEVLCEYEALAVSVDPLSPNETLFELLNVNADARLLVVPADRLNEPCVDATVTDAVMRVEPLIPNVTLFEFEKTTVPEVPVCVPAAIAPGAVDWEKLALAVSVPALSPNDTLFELLSVNAEDKFDVVPALRLNEPCVLATVADAVTVDPFNPKLTLFEFDSTNAVRLLLVVPAETFTLFAAAATDAVICEDPDIPNVTPFEFAKTKEPLVPV